MTAASRTTIGALSYREGNTNSEEQLYSASRSAASVMWPGSAQTSSRPSSFIFDSTASSSGPLPASTRRKLRPSRLSRAEASSTRRMFFFQLIWPTKSSMGSSRRPSRRFTRSAAEGSAVLGVTPFGITRMGPLKPYSRSTSAVGALTAQTSSQRS